MRRRELVAHLESSLNVDFQDDLIAARDVLLDGSAGRAVAVAAVRRPFQQAVLVDELLEFLRGREAVVDAIHFSLARLARGNRHGRPSIGDLAQKTGHQRALASTRWPRGA